MWWKKVCLKQELEIKHAFKKYKLSEFQLLKEQKGDDTV